MFSIENVCSTSKNPQSNTVCEQMPQTVGNLLQTIVQTNPLQNITHARNIVNDHWSLRCIWTTVAKTLGNCPASLAFLRHFRECATSCWLAGLHVILNIMLMRIYSMLIGSVISMIKLWGNKFWRKCTIQLRWDQRLYTIDNVHVKLFLQLYHMRESSNT